MFFFKNKRIESEVYSRSTHWPPVENLQYAYQSQHAIPSYNQLFLHLWHSFLSFSCILTYLFNGAQNQSFDNYILKEETYSAKEKSCFVLCNYYVLFMLFHLSKWVFHLEYHNKIHRQVLSWKENVGKKLIVEFQGLPLAIKPGLCLLVVMS